MADFYSGTGDDGTTGLLGEGRVAKDHPRPQAFGALDEASAALGAARAITLSPQSAEIVLKVQRDLYRIMAEVAAHSEHAARFRSIGEQDVRWLEDQLSELAKQVPLPRGFVVPGDCPSGAAIDVARTVIRRAERLVVGLSNAGELENPQLQRYLNRLSSLCFALALRENQLAGIESPSMAKHDADGSDEGDQSSGASTQSSGAS